MIPLKNSDFDVMELTNPPNTKTLVTIKSNNHKDAEEIIKAIKVSRGIESSVLFFIDELEARKDGNNLTRKYIINTLKAIVEFED